MTTPSLDYPFSNQARQADRDRSLRELLEMVWESALGLPVQWREQADPPAEGAAIVEGSVRIGGAWEGVVALACTAGLAATCAAKFYERPAADLSPAEIGDAWGELTNMVGGNLKALIVPPTRLAIPEVVQGGSFTFRRPGMRMMDELTFACLGGRIRLTVLTPEQPL